MESEEVISGIECPKCGDQIYSRHRHDMRYCRCEYCYIDGGRDYTRVGWGSSDNQQSVFGPPKDIKLVILREMESGILVSRQKIVGSRRKPAIKAPIKKKPSPIPVKKPATPKKKSPTGKAPAVKKKSVSRKKVSHAK